MAFQRFDDDLRQLRVAEDEAGEVDVDAADGALRGDGRRGAAGDGPDRRSPGDPVGGAAGAGTELQSVLRQAGLDTASTLLIAIPEGVEAGAIVRRDGRMLPGPIIASALLRLPPLGEAERL